MAELNADNERVDSEQQRLSDSASGATGRQWSQAAAQWEPQRLDGRYVIQLIALAIVALILEVGLFAVMPEGSWSIGRATLPIAVRPAGMNFGTTVTPGNSVVWQGAAWVSVTQGNPMMRGAPVSRDPLSRLVAIDLETGKPRETDLHLEPAPVGLVVVDDVLWAVSETVVFHVQNGQLIQRNPRRMLMKPTKPFVYEGRLAVIDQDQKDVYTLLTWNNGEWDEVGRVDAPTLSAISLRFKPELRVVSDGHEYQMFFYDGGTISIRQGIVFIPDDAPISALHPENDAVPPALMAASQAAGFRGRGWNSPPAIQRTPGWRSVPLAVNWNEQWDVALIAGECCVFVASNASTNIQCYRIQGADGVRSTIPMPISVASLSFASGSPGYFVNENLQLFAIKDTAKVEQITTGLRLTEEGGSVAFLFAIFSRYFISIAVLGLGTWWLMRTHRSRHYLYGKRNVVQASILRRGTARVIDSIITVYPPLFWFMIAAQNANHFERLSGSTRIESLFLLTLFSIFGIWVCGLLILSYAEGRWGVTPGKWLCGIRTFRTTLRPCGMLRALARELMVYVDSLLLITWIPGVLSIAVTNNWQRLGDLTADTVVVMNPNHRSWFK